MFGKIKMKGREWITKTNTEGRTHKPSILVGARGFEPPPPASRTRCATGLRYAPIPTILSLYERAVKASHGNP